MRAGVDLWRLTILLLTLLLGLPVAVIAAYVFVPAGDVWQHLLDTLLGEYIINSLLLMLGVGVGVLLLGVSSAWLVTACDFPLRRFFQWALLLPLAMPAYIIAYTYAGMLDFAGPVQTLLRSSFDWQWGDYWFPDVHSVGGAIAMFSLVLYPYVYLLARAALLEQTVTVLEVSRSLGLGPWQTLFRVALPLARPAIVTGLALALMETLADYGTVQYFGIDTFTTGIFRTWFGLGDSAAAAQLSAVLLGFVLTLLLLERWSRRQARYHQTTRADRKPVRIKLTGRRGIVALLLCALPLLLGFLIPAAQLALWAIETAGEMLDSSFIQLTWNSLKVAGLAAFIALIIALLLNYGHRLRGNLVTAFALRMAALGYAIPGTVIAVGVMLPFAWVDNRIDSWLRAEFDFSSGLLLSGTLFILLFAYVVRFLGVSLQTVEASLGKIPRSMDEAGRSLGLSSRQVLGRIHIPLMRASLLTALLLVFVDVLKELPATLILRPFNFNTLAVRAFELASDERLADSSSAALAIVAAGLLPVILLSRAIAKERTSST